MEVTYLHHSGFCVELDNVILIFDPISQIPENILNSDKPKLILVSHAHGDHYSRLIWDYENLNTTYILSSDIYHMGRNKNVIKMDADQEATVDGVHVRTFGSTDQGVSFLVEDGNTTVFFAGDLNWWAWDTRSHPNINPEAEERDYKREIEKLKNYLGNKRLDLAFVPVDPRLDLPGGELWATDYFILELAPKKLVPMHFWGDFDVINRLKRSLKTNITKIGTFTGRNQVVSF